ncbi:MAG: biotin--[acetyl-CoA-carboxylase] ligase [Oscillospiraceae bacterium]|nr:biotin--[acetyl-CoA-carboxylase] ligase [Oscillospiraceae bacterium]
MHDYESDTLTEEGIKSFMNSTDSKSTCKVHVFREIDSTNIEAKKQAIEGAPHGTVILSDCQTAGKGRQGKKFFSPRGTGIYMSIILYPDKLGFSNPTVITAYAAVCVCKVIERLSNLNPQIKWVNDIFLNGKKICGILTEVITESENQGANIFVLGIGINVSTRQNDFPDELGEIATSLYADGKVPIKRDQLVAEIIKNVLHLEKPSETQIFEQYKARLFVLNKEITVIQGEESYMARAIDIDEHGHLIVQTSNGEMKTLISGEIKIRNQ